jgi:ABC-type lipoprotein export system ATPase subunit
MTNNPSIRAAGTLIIAERLTRVYNGVTDTVTTAVSDVNLVVRAGEIVLILGPSGSG